MSKWTDKQLKQEAIRDYKECYEYGHFPTWTDECQFFDAKEWQKWANEYDMTVEEFKKYTNYFFECSANQL